MSELNEKISAWFEPRTFDLMEHPSRVSPKGLWTYIGGKGWQPPDYFTDEAANARLLQVLVDKATPYGIAVSIGVRHGDSYDGKSVYWLETTEKYGDEELVPVQEANSIKEAVVLAFCKLAGIEVGP